MYSSQRLFMEQKMDTNRLTFNYLSRYTSVIGIQIIIRYYICKALFVTFKNKIKYIKTVKTCYCIYIKKHNNQI